MPNKALQARQPEQPKPWARVASWLADTRQRSAARQLRKTMPTTLAGVVTDLEKPLNPAFAQAMLNAGGYRHLLEEESLIGAMMERFGVDVRTATLRQPQRLKSLRSFCGTCPVRSLLVGAAQRCLGG